MLTLRPIRRRRAAKISSLVMRTARARLNPDTTIHKTINVKTAEHAKQAYSLRAQRAQRSNARKARKRGTAPFLRTKRAKYTKSTENVISDRFVSWLSWLSWLATRRAQPARRSQRLLRQLRRDRRQRRQRPPDGSLAHRQVLIVRALLLLPRGDARAHAEPQGGQWKHRHNLLVSKRMLGMISAHDRGGRRQRIRAVEHRVGDRYGRVGDRPAVHHVAEIDDADHFGT